LALALRNLNGWLTKSKSQKLYLHHSGRNHFVRNNFALAGAGGLFCGMAWRIHDSVIRGVRIDNRLKGRVARAGLGWTALASR